MTNKELLNDEALIINAGYAATIEQLNLIINAKDMRIAELEKERESLLRLISYVKSIVFSKVKCSYVSFRRPLEELLKDQSNG
jgi:hypothetical protein